MRTAFGLYYAAVIFAFMVAAFSFLWCVVSFAWVFNKHFKERAEVT